VIVWVILMLGYTYGANVYDGSAFRNNNGHFNKKTITDNIIITITYTNKRTLMLRL